MFKCKPAEVILQTDVTPPHPPGDMSGRSIPIQIVHFVGVSGFPVAELRNLRTVNAGFKSLNQFGEALN
jgi:hypothetical protein